MNDMEAVTELHDGPDAFERWPTVCGLLGRVTAPPDQPTLLEAFLAADGEAVRLHARGRV